MEHEPWCSSKAFRHEDAARRIADTYALHRLGAGLNAVGKWFASRLNDGTTDNTLYDSKQEAVRFQHGDEDYYTFIKINPHTMNACEAAVMLKTARFAADNGMRLADPRNKTGGKELIKRLTVEDQMAQAGGRNTNLTMPWEA